MLEAAVAEDRSALSALLGGVDFAERWMHFPETLAWIRDYLIQAPDELGWWTNMLVLRQDLRLIGTAGFKGLPEPDGSVELGYEIAEAYQNQGLATEAAAALIDDIFKKNGVQLVKAHTLAEQNASGRVLKKLGFHFVREKIDIRDGRIWEFSLVRSHESSRIFSDTCSI
jgi:RimJ/RimL family protein N-acetyltransferase